MLSNVSKRGLFHRTSLFSVMLQKIQLNSEHATFIHVRHCSERNEEHNAYKMGPTVSIGRVFRSPPKGLAVPFTKNIRKIVFKSYIPIIHFFGAQFSPRAEQLNPVVYKRHHNKIYYQYCLRQ